jgi:hypothetical protein
MGLGRTSLGSRYCSIEDGRSAGGRGGSGEISSSKERDSRRAPQDGRTPGLRLRALLTENGVERVELARA